MLEYLCVIALSIPFVPYSGAELIQLPFDSNVPEYLQSQSDPDCLVIINTWTNIAGTRVDKMFIWNTKYNSLFTDDVYNYGIPLDNRSDVYKQISLLRYRGYKVAWSDEALNYYLDGVKPSIASE